MSTKNKNKSEKLFKSVNEGICHVINKFNKSGQKLEDVREWNGMRFNDVFSYSAYCEYIFERSLYDIKGTERQTTFTSDLSIAEWCYTIEGIRGVVDTITNAVRNFRNDLSYTKELALAIAWKGEEHVSRGNRNWAHLWYDLFNVVYNALFNYYEDEERSEFWRYLD